MPPRQPKNHVSQRPGVTSEDRENPFIGSSNGTANNPGLGCSGCHEGVGLHAHHAANGITGCAFCHPGDGAPPAGSVKPPYCQTADTRADNPCNGAAASNTNENWSIGDFLGLDNDGNNLYEMADFGCGPYRIVEIGVTGNNVDIRWETAGADRCVGCFPQRGGDLFECEPCSQHSRDGRRYRQLCGRGRCDQRAAFLPRKIRSLARQSSAISPTHEALPSTIATRHRAKFDQRPAVASRLPPLLQKIPEISMADTTVPTWL